MKVLSLYAKQKFWTAKKTWLAVVVIFAIAFCGMTTYAIGEENKEKEASEPLSLKENVEIAKNTSDIFANVMVSIGGVMGISYIWRAKEKQKEATFGYLTKLNVRLIEIRKILVDFKDEVMDRFIQAEYMRELPGDRISLINDVIKSLSKEAKETLKFIKKEDSQFPAEKGWSERIKKLVNFLADCERIKHRSYYCIFGENSEQVDREKEEYYIDALSNIDELIGMIEKRQEKLESKLFKWEHLFGFWVGRN